MTNREIKLVLAKAALIGDKGGTPHGWSLQELYEWVMEEPKVDVDLPKTDYDDKPASSIVNWLNNSNDIYYRRGYSVRLERIFKENNIKTIGDLLRIGKTNFGRLKNVGSGCVIRINHALEEVYGITDWYTL